MIDPSEWQVDNGDGSFSISAEGYRRHVAPDVDPAVTAETFARLRPQFVKPFFDTCPLDAIPDLEMTGRARTPVAGEVPNPLNQPSGCTFHPRCPHANERCKREVPVIKLVRHAAGESYAACHAVEEGRI